MKESNENAFTSQEMIRVMLASVTMTILLLNWWFFLPLAGNASCYRLQIFILTW
jgi:hypothetical protein